MRCTSAAAAAAAAAAPADQNQLPQPPSSLLAASKTTKEKKKKIKENIIQYSGVQTPATVCEHSAGNKKKDIKEVEVVLKI